MVMKFEKKDGDSRRSVQTNSVECSQVSNVPPQPAPTKPTPNTRAESVESNRSRAVKPADDKIESAKDNNTGKQSNIHQAAVGFNPKQTVNPCANPNTVAPPIGLIKPPANKLLFSNVLKDGVKTATIPGHGKNVANRPAMVSPSGVSNTAPDPPLPTARLPRTMAPQARLPNPQAAMRSTAAPLIGVTQSPRQQINPRRMTPMSPSHVTPVTSPTHTAQSQMSGNRSAAQPLDAPASGQTKTQPEPIATLQSSAPPKPEVKLSYAAAAARKPPQHVTRRDARPSAQMNVQHTGPEGIVLTNNSPGSSDVMPMQPVHSKTFTRRDSADRQQRNSDVGVPTAVRNNQTGANTAFKPHSPSAKHINKPEFKVRDNTKIFSQPENLMTSESLVSKPAAVAVPGGISVEGRRSSMMRVGDGAQLQEPPVDAPAKKEADVRRKSITSGQQQWKKSKYFDVGEAVKAGAASGCVEPGTYAPHQQQHAPVNSQPTSRPPLNRANSGTASDLRNNNLPNKPPISTATVFRATPVHRDPAESTMNASYRRKGSKDSINRRGSNASTSSKSSRGSRKAKDECSVM